MSRGGLSGAGPLPDRGGLVDQPALLMEAFQIMNAAEAQLKKRS